MELYDTNTFLDLVPYYHEKKADVFLMFFRMNNISLFEVCRGVREEFTTMIQSKSFQDRFYKEFFIGDEIDAEKYATFIVYLMFLMNRYIVQQFKIPSSQRGGTRRIRHTAYKVPQTQSKFNKSRSQRYKRKQARENPRGQSQFTSPFAAHEHYDTLWRSLIFEADPTWKNLEVQRLSSKEIEEYQQLIRDKEYISLAIKSLKLSGEMLLFTTFVLPAYFIVLFVNKVFRYYKIDRITKKNRETLNFLYLISQFTAHVVSGAHRLMKPTKIRQRVALEEKKQLNLVKKISTLKQYSVPTSENIRVVSPIQSMVPISTLSKQLNSTLPESTILATNITLASGPMGNINTMHDLYKDQEFSEVVAAAVPVESTQSFFYNNSESHCQVSEPLSTPTGTKAIVNEELLQLTRYIHSVSLTNKSAGEYAFLMILDEKTGELNANNTITTTFERHSTCVADFDLEETNRLKCYTKSKIPQNAAIVWHLHPWKLDRFISHQSSPDLKHTLYMNFMNGVPYGAAHAPEGMYIYSPQKSTVDFINRLHQKGPNITKNVYEEIYGDMAYRIDKAHSHGTECRDLSSRKITQYKNLGKIKVVVDEKTGEKDEFEFGMDIQFINQGDLSKRKEIDIGNYDIFKNIQPVSHEKIPGQNPMSRKDLWDELFEKVYSAKFAESVGEKNYEGIKKLPNPFEGQVTSKHFKNDHPYPIEKMQSILLTNQKLFSLFQKEFRASIPLKKDNYGRQNVDDVSIQAHFMDTYKKTIQKVLNDESYLYAERNTDNPFSALHMYLKGMFSTEGKKTDEIKKELANLKNMLNNLN